MKTTAKKPLEEYLSLPEGYPAELIGGEIRLTPSPSYKHQKTAFDIAYELRKFVYEKDLGEVLYEFDVHLDDENVLRPDVLFISKEGLELLKENWIDGAPDMVVEVLSPSTAVRDLMDKREIYEKFGVREYWIVDPSAEEIYVLYSESGRFKLICKGKKCGSRILKGFEWGFTSKR